MKKNIFTLVVFTLLVGACSPMVHQQGYQLKTKKMDTLVKGKATKKDVLSVLGSPTTRSEFDQETWHYVSRKTERVAFFKPDVVDQKVITVKFDKKGLLKDIKQKGLEAKKDVRYVTRETPTVGKKMSVMEQLIGNIGRFNKDKRE